MQEPKFTRQLQIGEYITPPNLRGIDADTEKDTELTINENHLWCKRSRNVEVLAGWVEKPLKDGVLTVVVNPLLFALAGFGAVIGARVLIQTQEQLHCEKCQRVAWTYIDCPICSTDHASTDLNGSANERFGNDGPFPIKCDACDTVFNVLAIEESGALRATIGTEVEKTVLQERSEERLRLLKESSAPQAMIDAEVENLNKLKGE